MNKIEDYLWTSHKSYLGQIILFEVCYYLPIMYTFGADSIIDDLFHLIEEKLHSVNSLSFELCSFRKKSNYRSSYRTNKFTQIHH